jgi:hypothetical protein
MRWNRAMLLVVAAGVCGCTDSVTAPRSVGDASRPLPPQEYALQLRGDPFLRSVGQMLDRPQVVELIDAALVGLDQSGRGVSDLTASSVMSAHFSLTSESADGEETAITETDVLNAVMTATLDRIAQVNVSPAAAGGSASDPPPR